jgi:hypothetical protein
MVTTTGLIQRLTILKTGFACVYIGPHPTNVVALSVSRVEGETPTSLTWKSSIVEGLAVAMAAHQQVQVTHGDTDTEISSLTLGFDTPGF